MIWENAQNVKFNERRRNQDLILLNSSKKSNFNRSLPWPLNGLKHGLFFPIYVKEDLE